jgi:hypothetical protein
MLYVIPEFFRPYRDDPLQRQTLRDSGAAAVQSERQLTNLIRSAGAKALFEKLHSMYVDLLKKDNEMLQIQQLSLGQQQQPQQLPADPSTNSTAGTTGKISKNYLEKTRILEMIVSCVTSHQHALLFQNLVFESDLLLLLQQELIILKDMKDYMEVCIFKHAYLPWF